MEELTFKPHCPLCKAKLEPVRRPAGLLTTGHGVCPGCRQQLSLYVSPSDNRLYVSMLTLPVTMADPGEQAWEAEPGAGAAAGPARERPASPRTAALPEVSTAAELEQYLREHFSPPEDRYDFFLTPGELCDVAERYADQLVVRWDDHDRRLSAERNVFVQLEWKEAPAINAIGLAGLYVFPNEAEARHVWHREDVRSRNLPVERVLDIRGRYALNFQSGRYAYSAADLETVSADELWPRIQAYCRAVGAPLGEPAAAQASAGQGDAGQTGARPAAAAAGPTRVAAAGSPARKRAWVPQKKWWQFWK